MILKTTIRMNTHSTNRFLWLEYIAVSIIVIAFFVISYCGFYMGDDLSMAHGEFTSLFDVYKHTWQWYHELGGRCFSVASQYLFCGLIGDKTWFDLVNTLFFLLLIMTCGKLINNSKEERVFLVLLFALLFWFLCPVPRETLFWVAGSTTHLWGNTLAFVFLWFFLKYKDDNFSIVGKTGLFFMSIVAAAEFIPCASICGAFVLFYAFRIKQFKGNVVPFVVGFAIGSVLLLFAPGNFGRTEWEGTSFLGNLQSLLHHPILEVVKYKALWMFLAVLVWGWIKNKKAVKSWMRSNSVLLLSLGWSIIAFSIVFRPENRALFFPETLSLVLFLRFLFDNYQVLEIRFFDERSFNSIKTVIITLLFVVFMVDSAYAISETKKQYNNNNKLLSEIANSGGIVVLDRVISSHRMAYVSSFPHWTWNSLADKYGLDSVHIYPFYCQDKFYSRGNTYIDEAVLEGDDSFRKEVYLIVRINNTYLQKPNNHVIFTIDYTRPRKWYKSWLDKWRNYQYDRTVVVEIDEPEFCFDDYCYYFIWFKRENAKNLKSVKYTIE